jgi:release factor glutamine methyltransferase
MPPTGSVVSGQVFWQWWQDIKRQTQQSPVSLSELHWFIQAQTNLDVLALRLETFRQWPEVHLCCDLSELTAQWQKRVQDRVPVQYLVGRSPWRQFELVVGPGVLIPRPETELIIDILEPFLDATNTCSNWADLGTGSGAIALGLAERMPKAIIHAVDCSSDALAIAQGNAIAYGLSSQIQFYQGSWFEPLTLMKGQLAGIVTNPPYIPSALIPTLQPEVAQHEPHRALDGGPDGLAIIRHLARTAPEYLRLQGIWLTEIMLGQSQTVVELLEQQQCYDKIQVFADLAGCDRFVLARHSPPKG